MSGLEALVLSEDSGAEAGILAVVDGGAESGRGRLSDAAAGLEGSFRKDIGGGLGQCRKILAVDRVKCCEREEKDERKKKVREGRCHSKH